MSAIVIFASLLWSPLQTAQSLVAGHDFVWWTISISRVSVNDVFEIWFAPGKASERTYGASKKLFFEIFSLKF